jgi:hypothetical protein
MSIEFERDIDGDSQQNSFQNATLQSGPPGYEFSVAVTLDVPFIGVYDQETLEQFIRRTFEPIVQDARVHIHVQMGREGNGDDYYWIDGIEAHEPDELPRHTGVEVIVKKGGWAPEVTLIASDPRTIMEYIRDHWGDSDPEWLQQVEADIQYGGPIEAREEV